MPTSKYFDQCPPFPPNTPVARLATISLSKLKLGDADESQKLYNECREWGFFLLNLRDVEEGEALLQDAEQMFHLTEETFALDQSTLDKFAFNPPKDLIGYKRQGVQKTDDGKRDQMQLYSIKQDDMLKDASEKQYASPTEARRLDIRKFMQHSHTVASVIFSQLDQSLGLPLGTLDSLCPLDQASETSLRILHAAPKPAPDYEAITLGGHTDIGTITLLFNVVGGLQVLPAGSENIMPNWRFVKADPGCVIVNLGDTMVEWTGGLLRSGLHRVVTAPGDQATVPRISAVYLLRPRATSTMNRLKGDAIPELEAGEKDSDQLANEWASLRAKQILLGELRPETRGGKPVAAK